MKIISRSRSAIIVGEDGSLRLPNIDDLFGFEDKEYDVLEIGSEVFAKTRLDLDEFIDVGIFLPYRDLVTFMLKYTLYFRVQNYNLLKHIKGSMVDKDVVSKPYFKYRGMRFNIDFLERPIAVIGKRVLTDEGGMLRVELRRTISPCVLLESGLSPMGYIPVVKVDVNFEKRFLEYGYIEVSDLKDIDKLIVNGVFI